MTIHCGLALGHFVLAFAGCLGVYFLPQAGLWPILLPVALHGARILLDRRLFHDRWIDGLLAIFLVTAVLGYWTAYDPAAAWTKLKLLLAGVVLYYAISTQPTSNLGILAGFWFVFGVGVAAYFLFTHDFQADPVKSALINKIGIQWMSLHPRFTWPSIQPTDTAAGLVIITSVYGFYFLKPRGRRKDDLLNILVLAGFGLAFMAVMLATSRGALLAMTAVGLILLVHMLVRRLHSPWRENLLRLFPWGVCLLIGLTALLLVFPRETFGAESFPGRNLLFDRSGLIRTGIAIMEDFPLLGGGLNAFPGLYSQYILVIPYYSIANSHDIFVDVMIEQGVLGGLAFLILYMVGLWKTASLLNRDHTGRMQVLYGCAFLSITIAILHGLVDDYLYSGWWSALAFFPFGMSMLVSATEPAYLAGSVEETALARTGGSESSSPFKRYRRGALALILGIVLLSTGLFWNRMAAQVFANIGAVKMDKIDLAGYPANHWDTGERVGELQSAKILFERSLVYNSNNRLANYRLGLIAMARKDFESAADYLEKAYQQDPSHRGIIKNLGYSYAWCGELNKAVLFLEQVPEAQSELEEYVWWWDAQGRHDLSVAASQLASLIHNKSNQP